MSDIIKIDNLIENMFSSYRRDCENLGFLTARTGPRANQKNTPLA